MTIKREKTYIMLGNGVLRKNCEVLGAVAMDFTGAWVWGIYVLYP